MHEIGQKKYAVTKNDIAQVIAPNKLIEISVAIRELVKDRKIEAIIIDNQEDNLSSPYYKIKHP